MPDQNLWHEIYMNLAGAVALQGTCPRAQVGAVLVRSGRPLSVGYNGAPPGMAHCKDNGCGTVDVGTYAQAVTSPPEATIHQGCVNAVHAELNAIAWAARNGIRTEGATLYCTHEPCIPCGQALLSARVVKVYYSVPYRAPFQFPYGMSEQLVMQ